MWWVNPPSLNFGEAVPLSQLRQWLSESERLTRTEIGNDQFSLDLFGGGMTLSSQAPKFIRLRILGSAQAASGAGSGSGSRQICPWEYEWEQIFEDGCDWTNARHGQHGGGGDSAGFTPAREINKRKDVPPGTVFIARLSDSGDFYEFYFGPALTGNKDCDQLRMVMTGICCTGGTGSGSGGVCGIRVRYAFICFPSGDILAEWEEDAPTCVGGHVPGGGVVGGAACFCSGAVATAWSFTVAGVANLHCVDCPTINRTWCLSFLKPCWYEECITGHNTCFGQLPAFNQICATLVILADGTSYLLFHVVEPPPITDTPKTLAVYKGSNWDCDGPNNTVNLVFANASTTVSCTNWPASITLTATGDCHGGVVNDCASCSPPAFGVQVVPVTVCDCSTFQTVGFFNVNRVGATCVWNSTRTVWCPDSLGMPTPMTVKLEDDGTQWKLTILSGLTIHATYLHSYTDFDCTGVTNTFTKSGISIDTICAWPATALVKAIP